MLPEIPLFRPSVGIANNLRHNIFAQHFQSFQFFFKFWVGNDPRPGSTYDSYFALFEVSDKYKNKIDGNPHLLLAFYHRSIMLSLQLSRTRSFFVKSGKFHQMILNFIIVVKSRFTNVAVGNT